MGINCYTYMCACMCVNFGIYQGKSFGIMLLCECQYVYVLRIYVRMYMCREETKENVSNCKLTLNYY